ncbi:MAG: hypothetical protein JXA97_12330 [Anaerolineales bacterium]|nr:hypothetical protein [Anaerolineales bacterium]
MNFFHESMVEYKKQLQRGEIQLAYQGLMAYFRELRTHFQRAYPQASVPGNIYYGYMDMTYFSFVPESLKPRKLKIAIVFLHEAFRFEVWLAAVNKGVQTRYWKLIKASDWKKYHLASTPEGTDSILDHVLIDSPDFSDLDELTGQIEAGTLDFIREVEGFLAHHRD